MASSRSIVTARTQGRREHRKLTTRRELLAAGRRLFSEEGLYESRIEDLSRHAGIAKGTLYGYFANKEELMEAVVTSGFSELLGHVHREAQGARSHTEVIARVAHAHLIFFEQNPDLMRIFHQVRGLLKFNRPEGLPLRRVLARYLAGLAHVLALHQSATRGSRHGYLETATLLFGAISGISSTRASLGRAASRNDRSRATIRALVALVHGFHDRPARREGAGDVLPPRRPPARRAVGPGNAGPTRAGSRLEGSRTAVGRGRDDRLRSQGGE